MPPLRLTSLLQTALPELSSASRAVISALGCLNGDAPSAQDLAAFVGLRDRHQLARTLRRDGLPSLEKLAGWARVLYWLLEADGRDTPLLELATRDGVDPAVAYRLVRRVTGQRWSEARRAGLPVALLKLRERRAARIVGERACGIPVRRRLAVAVGDDVAWSHADRTPRPVRATLTQPPRGVLAGRHPVTGSPFDVATTAHGITLVTRVRAAAVDVIRLRPFETVGSVRTGPAPTRVVVDAAGTTAYVTSQFAEEVGIIDVPALRQTGAIHLPGHPLGAVLSPDGRTLFVTTNLDRLCAVSITTGRIVAAVPVPMGCPQITTHPSGERVYVPCWRAGVIAEVDAHTLQTMRRFEVGGIAQDVVVSDDGLTLYAANQAGWLDAIHLATGRRTTRPLGGAALGLALSPDQEILLVSLVFTGRVAVIDRDTLNVRTMITTGGKPRLIAFDRSAGAALIANEVGWVDIVR
jgi:DNA-binding beta-propeller fold protein YncE